MSFNDDFLRAEAIREIRASGCTLPGVAELIVEHHGAAHVLADIGRIQALGEEVAASDTETGAKMRALLRQTATTMDRMQGAASDVLEKIFSKSSESQTAADAGADTDTGSVSKVAADVNTSPAATGNSATPGASPAPTPSVPENPPAQG